MIIEGNKIYAENNLILRRRSDYCVVGTERSLGYIYYLDGKKLDEKIFEVPEDYEEVSIEQIRCDAKIQYPIKVENYIREKYSASDEFAIQRQRDTKPVEFREYFQYCEDCKQRAKQILEYEQDQYKL